MFKINESISREENIKLAEESAAKAKTLLNAINNAIKEGFKHVPRYGNTPSQNKKLASAAEVISRLESETRAGYNTKSTYETRDRLALEMEKKAAAEREALERETATEVLKGEAIQYLIERGKKINVDFTVETAITAANQLAFEYEVKRRDSDGPIDFSGDDNCEDCSGWVPGNRRCECGNRRVDWVEGWGHSFKTPSIHAEAW